MVAETRTCYGTVLLPGQVTVELIDGRRVSFEPYQKVSIYKEGS